MVYSYPLGRLPRQLTRHLTTPRPGRALAALLLGLGGTMTPVLAQGTFSAPVSYSSGGSQPIGISAGDLNNDGRADLVVDNFNSNTSNVGVLLNVAAPAAAGTFPATATTYYSGGTRSASSAIADLNGDGRRDIVVSNINENTVGVLLNAAAPAAVGTFPVSATTYATGDRGPLGIALGDVNGDGRVDIVVAHQDGNTLSVLLNAQAPAAAGTFSAPVSYTVGSNPYIPRLGDFNGDGRLDIAVSNYIGNSVSVLLNSAVSPGTFGPSVSYGSGGNNPLGMALGDVNGDGRLDIVANHLGTAVVGVLLNSATSPGTFGTATTYNSGGIGEGLDVADVSGDGRPDLVVTRNTGTVGVLVNAGTGPTLFPTVASYTVGSGLVARVVLADLNNDGPLDIAVSNNTNGSVVVLRNTSTVVAPTLSNVSPPNGPVGTSVTLKGTNLTGATGVRFNGTAATTFAVVNATTITATVPAGATTGNVTVTTPSGTSNGVAFAVNPTVAISSSAGTSGGTTATTPIPFTITFSQSVTGFVSGDVTVTNGTVSSFSGSGTTYSLSVEPTMPGTATTVSVAANVAQTTAGTGNVASAPFSLQYDAPATVTYWEGTVSTDWFTAANWSDGVPTSTMDAIVPTEQRRYPVLTSGTANVRSLDLYPGSQLTQTGGTLALAGNLNNDGEFSATGGLVRLTGGDQQTLGGSSPAFRFWDLTVGPSTARLTSAVQVQRVLTLNGNLRSDGNLTLLSNATGTAMVVNNGSSVVGTATMQRYLDPSLNPGLGYRHYSTPMQESLVSDVSTATYSPVFNTEYNTVGNTVTPFPTMYGYDESRITGTDATTQAFEYGYYSPAAADQMVAGFGYTVNIGANETVALTGTLTTGDVTIPLARGAEANSGWQLLGNPYPAPLDWNKAGLPDGVQRSVYVYKSSSQYGGTYQFYQNGVGTLPGGLIGAMQGFFLRVDFPSSLTFRDTWRATAYADPSFNRPAADTRPLVQLDLVSAQGTHEPAYIYFEAGATAGIDGQYDAQKLPNTTGLNLSSAAAGTSLAVNGLPLPASATAVPLHVGVPTTGTYTLQAASLLNLSATDVYLHDALTGQRINLKQQPSYSFSASNAALITNRFTLHLGAPRPLSAQSNFTAASVSVYPNPAHRSFTVAVPAVSGATQATLTLYNLLGQAVQATTLALPAAGARTSLDVQTLPVGVYMLRVQANNTTITKQVVIN